MAMWSSPRPETLGMILRQDEIHLESHVDFKLAFKTVANLTARHVLPFATCKRRIIHEEVKGDGRLINGDGRKRLASGSW